MNLINLYAVVIFCLKVEIGFVFGYRQSEKACCRIPFVLVGQNCMFIGHTKLNYDRASSFCHGMGAMLASPKTHESLWQYKSFINDNKANYDYYWISATDRSEEGSWKWADGSTLSANDGVYWNPSEPNDYGSGEDCAAAKAEDQLLLLDIPCDWKIRPVCEYTLV